VVLDSETTGLGNEDEVIELALVHATGTVLFCSLIQPQDPQRPDLATHIHGITRQLLSSAPSFPEVWPTIQAILRRYRREVTPQCWCKGEFQTRTGFPGHLAM
jgi:DNA polymerase III epsilon subunit-like protein